MIRYPAFDPPEYADWKPDPQVLHEYRQTIEKNEERREIVLALKPPELIEMYEDMVRNRLHDITLKRWVKQGVISKAWLGTGEEAATIGPVHALARRPGADGLCTDFVAPMIRNAGACHGMGMPVADMLRGYLGTADSPTGGRDLHIGDFRRGVLAPISHVGEMVPVAAGVALSFKVRKEPRVAITWVGDGSSKAGPFHEGMNFAAARRLPLIVIIQNNQVALGTRLEQYHRGSFLALTAAYGVEGWRFDGNNVLDAYAAVKIAADRARGGASGPTGPFLLVAETFRMGGHATHDEREARETLAPDLFEYWGKRDPIGLYETYLAEGDTDLETGSRSRASDTLREHNTHVLRRVEERVTTEIERAAQAALASARTRMPDPESAAEGVFAEQQRGRDCFRRKVTMKSILVFLVLSLSLGTFAEAQRRKGPPSRSRTSAKKPAADAPATPTVAGSPVTILTKEGNKIVGAVVDMNVSAVRVKAEDQESSVPMTTVSSLSFGPAPTGEVAHPAGSSGHPDFQKDAASVMSGFHLLLGEAKTAPDYTEYGGTLAELRRRADLFIGKYGSTEDPLEAHFVALAASAVTDYTWARTIWALKLGHTGDVAVSRSDSPAVADTVGLYPEVRSAAAASSGDRYSVEKLIVGLWTQAGIKVERLRSLIGQTH